MDFAKRLTHFREASGLSKNQLSIKSGVSQPYIGDIESGKKKPTIDTIERLCEALGVTLSQFFSSIDDSLPPDIQQLIETTKKLPPEERKALNEYLNIRLSQTEGQKTELELPAPAKKKLPDFGNISVAAKGGLNKEDLTDEKIEQIEKELDEFKERKRKWKEMHGE
ncbi:helix-turn-helix transcriptional regulator [Paenibacillus mesophilus]|uniref:helix-turn-helix domain-containing protein n=1 Tax=Paenibacillus mesophilus TaxID=2582849 RepID=UPI00110DA4CF|nr:helix-turn-helix transcriptional regulator [Paenibacillus mesophilus]TMV49401.1 helix-turn-helix transcriptional regulator [Paenibacillus mesophilus]